MNDNTNALTDEQIDQIATVIEDANANSPSGIAMKEATEYEPTEEEKQGYTATAETIINPDTGEIVNTGIAKEEKVTVDEALSDLGEADVFDEDFDVTADDIKKSLGDDASFLDKDKLVDLSDEELLKMVDIVNKVRNNENVNVFVELPKPLQDLINTTILGQGYAGFSVEANTMRKSMARMLIDELISNISMDKYLNTFNSEIENIVQKVGTDISVLYKEYEQERETYINKLLEQVPEDDPKRELLIKTIDSIHDAYALERLKAEAANFKRIKHIELVKPQNRVFDSFESKYKDSPYNIYKPAIAVDILNKHNDRADKDDNLRFVINFCKFCYSYDPAKSDEHAFMYYTIYNIMLLEIYKEQEYKEFATDFLNNINEIIDQFKK